MYNPLSALVARAVIDERLLQAERARLVREARRARRAQRAERRGETRRRLPSIPRQRTAPPSAPPAHTASSKESA